jgi:hypothetical protein
MAAPKLGSIGPDEQGVCAAPRAHVLPMPCFMQCCARSACTGLNSEVRRCSCGTAWKSGSSK